MPIAGEVPGFGLWCESFELTGRYIDLKKSPSSVSNENTRVLNRSFAGLTKLPSGRMKQSVSQSKQSSSR
ncbi:hypothetical protein NCCP2716_00840 [Sporosarcina sp. NCCP-2716]|nr:hypothetical protein NCCP2716_00840 [Sporosarcina sp. NCCP-2716]